MGDGESFETEEKTGPTPRTMSRFTATLRSCGRQAWDPSGFGSVRKAPVSTNYDVGKKIGSGAFASVYVATAKKDRALAPCPDAYLLQDKVAVCVEIKSSTRLQCARMRRFRRKSFCCASRTR